MTIPSTAAEKLKATVHVHADALATTLTCITEYI